ncbi:hypothetical protein [uncultured Kordia sp.]|uniref:hypothetical protein n=1 Tax=uncultured Kordia sp. TaxID=507699 RepID=UPI00260FF558|nr:hypothetical protein [uncultured Kordia sp.]
MDTNCKVLLTSQVNENVSAELMVFLKENLPKVRNFNGCISVEILFNVETNNMVFHEVWKSKVHHVKYIEFITANGIMNSLANFLVASPEIQYYTIENI